MSEDYYTKEGSVTFYIDPNNNDLKYAIQGMDNKNFISIFAVKRGLLGTPSHLSFFDMWFTDTFSSNEIRGFSKLAALSEESFDEKQVEIEQKFEDFRSKCVWGKISAGSANITLVGIRGRGDSRLGYMLSYFENLGYINGETWVNVNDGIKGKVKDMISRSTDSALMLSSSAQKEDPEVMELIKKYQLGDKEGAGNQLIEKYDGLIHSILEKYKRNYKISPNDEQDLLQDAYVKFLTKLSEYDPQKGKLSTYIYNTIDGLIKNSLNRGAANPEISVDPQSERGEDVDPKLDLSNMPQSREPIPGDTQQQNQMVGDIQSAIDSLPENEKGIINSYFYSGKTLEQIGIEMGTSKQRIKQIVDKALESLRVKLQDYDTVEAIKIAMIFNTKFATRKSKKKLVLCTLVIDE